MKNIGSVIRTIRVPIELIYVEFCYFKISDYHPSGDYLALMRGEVVNVAPYALAHMKKHLEEGKLCGYEFTLPATLQSDGKFQILDGHHRSYLACSMGATHLNLQIHHISPAWQHYETMLMQIYGKKSLYQDINHPWFNDWERIRQVSRFDVIKKVLDQVPIGKSKVSLDIGSCTGWLCRKFAEIGFIPVGFDADRRVVQIAEWLNTVFDGHPVTYYVADGDNALELFYDKQVSVYTCLSVLHHFLWNEGRGIQVDKFKKWISLMASKSRIAFIDIASQNDQLVATDKVPLDPNQFIQWMKNNCGVKSAICLGTAGDSHSRPMFAISNEYDLSSVQLT